MTRTTPSEPPRATTTAEPSGGERVDAASRVHGVERLCGTIGQLREALSSFADDCPLLLPVSLIFYLDLTNGSSVEVVVEEGR